MCCAASDYPFTIGETLTAPSVVNTAGLSVETRAAVLGGGASRLFRLDGTEDHD